MPAGAASSRAAGWASTACLATILILAAGVRLGNLHRLPSFIDESAHIWGATDYTDYPLAMRARIGKILGYVIFYPTARFAADPLFATRILVALLGVLTVLGLYLAVRRMAGRQAGAIAAAIWSFLPYITFHDRMALHDPLISCFLAWAIMFFVRFLDRHDKLSLLLAGLFTGCAIATKVTALQVLVWLLLLAVAWLGVSGLRHNFRLVALFGIGMIGPLLLFIPGAGLFLKDNAQFVESGSDQVSRASLIVTNFGKLISWITVYNSIAFTLFCGVVLFLALRHRTRLKTALLFCVVLSCMSYMPVFRVWFPRYFLPALLPVIMLAGIVTSEQFVGAAASWQNRKAASYRLPIAAMILAGLLAFSAVSWAAANWHFQNNPQLAHMPDEDRFQYLDGWPSGTGVPELAGFFGRAARQSGSGILVLYGKLYGSHVPWSVPLYNRNPDVHYREHPITNRMDLWRALLEGARQPTYLVMEPPIIELPPDLAPLIAPPLRPSFEFKRPSAPGGFLVYRLDRSTYVSLPSIPAATASGDEPKIVDIINSNGMEKMDGETFTWIGQDWAIVHLRAPRAGLVDLVLKIYPGPSMAGTGQHRLLIKSSQGFTREIVRPGGKAVIAIPVAAGDNEILLGALDKPNVPSPLPNGDLRTLIVGLGGFQIENFRLDTGSPAGNFPLATICSASFGAGWYGRENSGKDWIRWNSGTSQLVVFSETPAAAVLRGELFSMPRPNTIDLYLQGRKLASWNIRGEKPERIADVALPLAAGENTLEFVSAQPAAVVPGDSRKLAVLVKNLEIAGKRSNDSCKLNP